MAEPVTINPRIIEGLYCDALVLSDEVRATFDMSARIGRPDEAEDLARVALSCEALRTTTRMMHAIAWLLNHRAFFLGELTEFQLRRHSRLAVDFPESDPGRLSLLEPGVKALIGSTERFYARLVRLDGGWRHHDPAAPSAVSRLRERLGVAAGR